MQIFDNLKVFRAALRICTSCEIRENIHPIKCDCSIYVQCALAELQIQDLELRTETIQSRWTSQIFKGNFYTNGPYWEALHVVDFSWNNQSHINILTESACTLLQPLLRAINWFSVLVSSSRAVIHPDKDAEYPLIPSPRCPCGHHPGKWQPP